MLLSWGALVFKGGYDAPTWNDKVHSKKVIPMIKGKKKHSLNIFWGGLFLLSQRCQPSLGLFNREAPYFCKLCCPY